MIKQETGSLENSPYYSPRRAVFAGLISGAVCSVLCILFCSHMVFDLTGQQLSELKLETLIHMVMGSVSCITTASVFGALLWKRHSLKTMEIRGQETLIG